MYEDTPYLTMNTMDVLWLLLQMQSFQFGILVVDHRVIGGHILFHIIHFLGLRLGAGWCLHLLLFKKTRAIAAITGDLYQYVKF
jgi:hypothetical protein